MSAPLIDAAAADPSLSGRGVNHRWQADAACLDAPTELFLPDVAPGQNISTRVAPVAALWCARCPVEQECGRWADRNRDEGLWGGVWRRYSGTNYLRTPLHPGAPLEPLTHHRRAPDRTVSPDAAHAHRRAAQGWPTDRIAAELKCTRRSVQRYLRTAP